MAPLPLWSSGQHLAWMQEREQDLEQVLDDAWRGAQAPQVDLPCGASEFCSLLRRLYSGDEPAASCWFRGVGPPFASRRQLRSYQWKFAGVPTTHATSSPSLPKKSAVQRITSGRRKLQQLKTGGGCGSGGQLPGQREVRGKRAAGVAR